jgi:hypothetical protein
MSATAIADIAELDGERVVLSKELERVDAELAVLLRKVPADTQAVARLCEEKRVYQERLREITGEEERVIGDQWFG